MTSICGAFQPEDLKFNPMLALVPTMGLSGSKAITGMDVCIRKPILVTCSVDRCVRVWNINVHTPNKPAGEFIPSLELVKVFDEEPTWYVRGRVSLCGCRVLARC